jgi:acyl-ACP thioesterase
MEFSDIWTDTYVIRSYQSDKFSRLHIHSLAHFLQESAWRHAEACKVGYYDLLKTDSIWILSGLKIRIYEYPQWSDEITVNTWSSAIEDLFAYRDYEIHDNRNEILAEACTSWLIMDFKTHRPCRMTKELREFPSRKIHSAAGKPVRLPALKTGSKAGSLVVQYSDIDIYQHVNNTRYIEWCTNRLPSVIWEDNQIEVLEINFLSECLIGQEIAFLMESNHGSFFRLSAHNQQSLKEVFRADISLRKKVKKEEIKDLKTH